MADQSEEEDVEREEEARDEDEQEESTEAESDAGSADESESDASEEKPAEEKPAEEEQVEEDPSEPDNQDAIVALKDIGARVDSNDKDRVWRIFFYDKHGDEALAQVHGLPALKEVWVLGTKITEQMKDRFVEQFPKVKVYYG